MWLMRIRLLLTSVLLLVRAVGATAQEELVPNPGFEAESAANGLPGGGWWVYETRGTPDVKVDAKVAHGGKASAQLQAATEARFVLVSPKFAVSPGDEIRFAAWLRGERLAVVKQAAYVGLAFRNADGGVFQREYVRADSVTADWTRLGGTAKARPEAVSAEIHLGYTNLAGTLWFDDVSAVITSPVSMVLVAGAQPWPGAQELALRVTNRQTNDFRGSLLSILGRKTNSVPVVLAARGGGVFKLPVNLAGIGAHDCRLQLLDASGAVLCAQSGKFRTVAPLTLFPAVPCYHAVGEGSGETLVTARLSVNPTQRKGLRLVVELSDRAGKALQTATADAAKGETVGVKLRVPVDRVGDFDLNARLLDAAGKELASARTDVKVAPRADSQVTLAPDGFLRVGGQPHFPIGMYSCGRYDEMGKAGFSGTHNYGITTGDATDAINPNEAHLKDLLDRSWDNGMRMMVELPRKPIEKAQWDSVRHRILTFRHHPGLLCWGSEERVARGDAPLAHLAALYRLVKELDPDHPLVLGDTRDVISHLQKDRRNFFPDDCMDAGIWWWYPIPLHGPDGNGLEGREPNSGLLQPPPWLTTTLSKKPLWIAIQSYQQPRSDARFPTPEEYRAMAYLSIINGVKGLWFYTGSGQKDWQGKPAGLLNQPEEGHWNYVQQLVRELREFSPVIVAKTGAATLTLAPADAPVEFTTREGDGALYVIAANKSDKPQVVHFRTGAFTGKRARVLYEKHPATIQGDSLAGDFAPFGVHVYRIE